jgi:hypothetical protein
MDSAHFNDRVGPALKYKFPPLVIPKGEMLQQIQLGWFSSRERRRSHRLEAILRPTQTLVVIEQQQMPQSVATKKRNDTEVFFRKSRKTAVVQPRQCFAFCAGPQIALTILVKLQEAVIDDAG